MDALQAIFTRRSIRHYTSEMVPPAMVETLLRAAMFAPSAGNEQPWHFVLITDRAALDEIADFHPFAAMMREATLAIVVCGDDRLQKFPNRWPQDCAAATQNILLAAHAQGLGAVWLGVYPDADRDSRLGSLVDLPVGTHPFSIVAVGYPAEERRQPERYKPDRVHHGRW